MQEQLYEILYYLKGALKYKWASIILAWVLCLCGWLYVSSMPNKYTSEAKVHVETRTMLQPLLTGMTIESDVRGLLRVMQQLMFTKGNLEQIIKLSSLDKKVKTPTEQERLIEDLKKDIHIRGGAEDIFTIQYEATSPDEAKNVVQAVLTVFSEQTQLSTIGNTDSAQRFIDEQLQEYEMRLRNGEKARENFKRANLGLLPGQGGDQIGQIQTMTAALEDAKLGLKEATSRKETLKHQLDEALTSEEDGDEWGDATGLGDANGGATVSDDPQVTALKQRKNELLIKYTEKHPEVAHIEKALKELQMRNAKKQANVVEAGGLDTAVLTNPYVQGIKVAINEADANLASINSRVDILQMRLQKAQDELNSRLSIETEMENLNRDYSAIKSNYEKLLASKETAAMSQKVDNQAEALKFKIADAPNTPLQPSSPMRKLLYSAVLIVGMVFGLVIALLLYLIRPTVMSVSQLRQVTGLPILGSVSMKANAIQSQRNNKDGLRYGIVTLGLFMIYIGFMTIDILGIKQLNLSYLLQSIH
jgi:polysaccharide chain length determinant protein (PEP-CTERM system associated)